MMQAGALEGLRLVEAGQLIAGPFCGQLMADHGAEVIKIEPPGRGDPMRAWGQDKPVWWPIVARNKKCITLDLRQAKGQEIARKLIGRSDFFLENFRPGTVEKWGLGFDRLSVENPRLIMIRVSGFGQTGPYSPRAGYGSIGEAMGGLRYIVGEPGSRPSRVGISIGDSLAATFACLGALLALQHRHKTGTGQMIDSAIYEAVLAMMESTLPEYTEGGHVRERTGSILPKVAPSNIYATRDGEILIAANQDSVWRRLAEAMGRPELGEDPRYATHQARGERQVELDAMIDQWAVSWSSNELLSHLERHGIPAGKIYCAPDMLSDAHFKSREAVVKVEDRTFKNLWMQNVFPKLSSTPGRVRWSGPELGEHNEEIYGGILGMSTRELGALQEGGVV